MRYCRYCVYFPVTIPSIPGMWSYDYVTTGVRRELRNGELKLEHRTTFWNYVMLGECCVVDVNCYEIKV